MTTEKSKRKPKRNPVGHKPIREFLGYYLFCVRGKHDHWKGSFGYHCWRCDFYEDHYDERDIHGNFLEARP